MKKNLLSLTAILLFNISASGNTPPASEIFQKDFNITLEWLEEKPKSNAKNFFITEYLKNDNISFEDAKTAYEMSTGRNATLNKLFNKKYKTPIPPEEMKCYRATIEELLKEDSKCIALGLSLQEAIKLSKKDLDFFITKLDEYPTLKNDLKTLSSDDPFNNLINSDLDRFFRLFFALGNEYRVSTFNKKLNKEFIDKISKEKSFERFLRYVVYNNKLTNLQSSLLSLENNKTLPFHILFILGINASNHNKPDIAYNFFYNAYNKAYLKSDKDKALFWIYLVTKNNSFLQELSQSWSINIYSLYAKEILNIPIDNIIYNIDIKNKKSSFDIYDAFKWMEVLDDTKKNFDEKKLLKYQEIFSDESTLPHYAFILERFNNYKVQYYITPFKEEINKYDIYKQVLIYSIAKQESRFIPSAISFSSAQGVMQIMPFLSLHISKKLNEEYNIYEQFIPSKNIKYSSIHLDSLIKQFDNNPLFIAYAYNGGAGYFKSQLDKGLFKKKGNYEPFLSMELVSYDETREYGKKVLANYYIYNNHLNRENKIKFSTIFQSLVAPN
uniref:lytic transglycosylase domain-containing protein n=1 Tax=Aliarcobacter sp. TaxID=2321116 RepID=UPI0040473B3C